VCTYYISPFGKCVNSQHRNFLAPADDRQNTDHLLALARCQRNIKARHSLFWIDAPTQWQTAWNSSKATPRTSSRNSPATIWPWPQI
jgi:hypothetical protein